MIDSIKHIFLNHVSQLLLLIIVFVITQSCASMLFNSKEQNLKSSHFTYRVPGSNWTSVDADTSDFAFMNVKSGAVITGNTICKKYMSTSLQELSSNIFSSVNNLKVTLSGTEKLFDRNTRITNATGEVDGIIISILAYTLKKNRCIYDFIMIYPSNEIPKNSHDEMRSFIQQIEIN